jgi:hypothetical protein
LRLSDAGILRAETQRRMEVTLPAQEAATGFGDKRRKRLRPKQQKSLSAAHGLPREIRASLWMRSAPLP